MRSSLTVGSLFSGCGGLDLGLEHAGFELAWACEADLHCRKVLAARWPDVPVIEDVRHVDETLPRVDVLAGGFPCQDLSYAGKGAGIDGERSGLWSEFARAIRVLRPGHVIVENVGALANRGLGRVLGDLAEAGYDTRWFCIRASDVGAPHRRERLFILATADAAGFGRDGRSSGEDGLRQGREATQAERARRDESGRCRTAAADADAAGLEGRVAVLERGGERAAGPGGLVAPADAEGERLERDRPARGRRAGSTDNDPVDWGVYRPAIERWEHILGRPAPAPTDERRRLSPAFVEWLMGLPDGWTDVPGVTRTARLRMLGNAVHVQTGEMVGRALA